MGLYNNKGRFLWEGVDGFEYITALAVLGKVFWNFLVMLCLLHVTARSLRHIIKLPFGNQMTLFLREIMPNMMIS